MKIHGTAKGGALSKKDFGVAFGGAPAEPVNLCNDATIDESVSFSSGYLRISSIDVSSLGSPFTPTHLGYTAGSGMDGNIALGLYTDNSGSPETLICQTASHAIDGDSPTVTYLSTTSTPSTSHSNLLWIGFITSGVTAPDFKGQTGFEPTESEYMVWDISNYPTFPTTFVSTGGSGTNWKLCLTSGA